MQTRQLCAFNGGTVVISVVIDETDIDATATVDPTAGDEPDLLARCRIHQVVVTNNGTRAATVECQGVTATVAAGESDTFNIAKPRRVALAKLRGRFGG
jgi:hypothetical protein